MVHIIELPIKFIEKRGQYTVLQFGKIEFAFSYEQLIGYCDEFDTTEGVERTVTVLENYWNNTTDKHMNMFIKRHSNKKLFRANEHSFTREINDLMTVLNLNLVGGMYGL